MVVLNIVLCLTEPAGRNVFLNIILVGEVRHDIDCQNGNCSWCWLYFTCWSNFQMTSQQAKLATFEHKFALNLTEINYVTLARGNHESGTRKTDPLIVRQQCKSVIDDDDDYFSWWWWKWSTGRSLSAAVDVVRPVIDMLHPSPCNKLLSKLFPLSCNGFATHSFSYILWFLPPSQMNALRPSTSCRWLGRQPFSFA